MQNGISVEKQASSKLLTITLLSSDPKFDEIYLSNYATLNVLDMLRRIPGVGRVSNVGSRYYAMQIWALPDKLANFGLTVQDLQNALKDQNRESAAGVLGQQPVSAKRGVIGTFGNNTIFVVVSTVKGTDSVPSVIWVVRKAFTTIF